MRRATAIVIAVPVLLLGACSSSGSHTLTPPTLPSAAAASSPAATPVIAAPSPSISPIPLAQDRAIRKVLLDLATAEEAAFTNTGAYVAFRGAVPAVLTIPVAVDKDFAIGGSLPTKDTYCLAAVHRTDAAFELYHSEGVPGLAASASDIPADCQPLIGAVVKEARTPTSATQAQPAVQQLVAAEQTYRAAHSTYLAFRDPVPMTLPVTVDEAAFSFGAVARGAQSFCIVAVLRSTKDYVVYDSTEGRFLPAGGPTPDDCSSLADALAGVTG